MNSIVNFLREYKLIVSYFVVVFVSLFAGYSMKKTEIQYVEKPVVKEVMKEVCPNIQYWYQLKSVDDSIISSASDGFSYVTKMMQGIVKGDYKSVQDNIEFMNQDTLQVKQLSDKRMQILKSLGF